MENNGISLEFEEMHLQKATLQQQLNEHLKLNEELLQKYGSSDISSDVTKNR